MKKFINIKISIPLLMLSLLLILTTSACGEKPAAGNGSSQDTPSGSSDAADDPSQSTPGSSDSAEDPSQSTPDNSDPGVHLAPSTPNVPGVGDNSSLFAPSGTGASSSYTLDDLFNGNLDDFDFGPFSSMTEFYNSDARVMIEDFVNQFLHELNDMIGVETFRSASISVQEPDRVIYTYQYNIRNYQFHGIPVNVIQLNYLNADGTLVYTLDITEDLDPSAITVSPDSAPAESTSGSLQEWLDSDEAAETVETINNLIASTGFTVSFAIDGNTLIYQYYLPAGLSFDDFTEEEREATFDAAVDANTDSVHTLFTMFAEEQGLVLDAVRFVVYSADGTELYSRDITP